MINLSGVKNMGSVQVMTTVVKFAALTFTSTVGLFYIKTANFTPWNISKEGTIGAIGGGMAIALVLLTAGRYAADNVQVNELVDQGRHLGGFWVGISQLPRSHPWTVRRMWRLHQLGLFRSADTVGQAHHSQEVA
jgi:hypothetical protein